MWSKVISKVEIQVAILDVNAEYRGDLTYDEYRAILSQEGIEVCRKTVFNWCKPMGIYMESSSIKLKLLERHCVERLRFILSMIDGESGKYKSLKNHLHLDEQWIYLHRTAVKRKMIDGKSRFDDDYCQHKGHLTQVMFISVIGCPDENLDALQRRKLPYDRVRDVQQGLSKLNHTP